MNSSHPSVVFVQSVFLVENEIISTVMSFEVHIVRDIVQYIP